MHGNKCQSMNRFKSSLRYGVSHDALVQMWLSEIVKGAVSDGNPIHFQIFPLLW